MNDSVKGAFKSWTVWFNLIVILVGILETQGDFIKSTLGDQTAGFVIALIGGVGIWLRSITREPLADKVRPRVPSWAFMGMLAGSMLVLGGCSNGGKIDLTDAGVNAAQTGASGSKIHTDGEQSAVTQGESPTLIWLDNEGIKKNTAGTTRTLGLNPATGQLFADTSSDVSFSLLEYTPAPAAGQPQLRIQGFNSGMTDLTKAKGLTYESAMRALESLSADRRAEVLKAWEVGGELGTAAITGLRAYFGIP